MIGTILEAGLEILATVAAGFVWWLLLFPVVWVASAPIILLLAVFRREPYGAAVAELFSVVTDFWTEWGLMLVP